MRSNGYNEITDNLTYDHRFQFAGSPGGAPVLPTTPIFSNLEKTGWASGVAYTGFYDIFSLLLPPKYFLNGIKLLSGEDYTHTALSGLRFKFDIPASSVLTKVIKYFIYSDDIYITGSKNLIKLSSGKFLKNTSQVYVNGMRQSPNYGYVEKSSFDLLSGNFSDAYDSLLYTSSVSDNFWNM